MKMMAVAPHLFDLSLHVRAVRGDMIFNKVWSIVLSMPRQCEKPTDWVRQYVPAPYFYIIGAIFGEHVRLMIKSVQ